MRIKRRLYREQLLLFSMLLLLLLPCAVFASESETAQESSDTERPVYPYLSIEIRIVGEPNEDGFYMQNWDEKAHYPIADLTQLQYEVYISNEGSVHLEEPFEEVWIGDFYSTSVYSDDVRTSANKKWKSRGGLINISDQDVERGYMEIRARYTAKCPDSAYAEDVEAEQKITIKVCARPEKEIVAYLETLGGSEVTDEQRAGILKGYFGSRYEKMRERVMAEAQQTAENEPEDKTEDTADRMSESESDIGRYKGTGSDPESENQSEIETETDEKAKEDTIKIYITRTIIFSAAAAAVTVVSVLMIVRRKKSK